MSYPQQEPQLVELDARRRTTLKLGHHNRYLVTEESDGTLIFKPALVLTSDDVALRSAPDLVDAISKAWKEPASRTKRRRRTVKD